MEEERLGGGMVWKGKGWFRRERDGLEDKGRIWKGKGWFGR